MMQSNRPVSPLSIMMQNRRYQDYIHGNSQTARGTGIEVSTQTVQRVVQESVEAVVRNIGSILLG